MRFTGTLRKTGSGESRAGCIFAAIVILLALAAPAAAQTDQHPEQACLDRHDDFPAAIDKRIDACLHVIGDSMIDADTRAEAYLRRALGFAQRAEMTGNKDDIDRAIADLGEGLRLDPNNVAAQRYVAQMRAGLHFNKGDYDAAVADYTTLLALEPNWPLGYSYRGIVFAAKGEHDRAIADFTEAIQLAPQPEYYQQRAISYLQIGKTDAALADANRAVALVPDNAVTYGVRALVERAMGNTDQVVGDLRKALSLDPSNADIKKELQQAETEQAAARAASAPAAAPAADATAPAANKVAPETDAAAARRDYELAAQVGNREAWEAFLKQYQTGFYADLARAQLAKLGAPAPTPDRAQAERAQAEKERLAKEQAEKERLAKEQAEKERLAREQAEKERLAKEQAEKERLAKEQAEKERLAKEQAEKERLAKEQAEKERLAKEQAEKERLAREQAEKERLAKEQAERERLAREQAEKERVAKEQAQRDAVEAAAKIKTAELTPPAANPAAPSASPVLAGGALITEIKKELTRVGCYAGPIDDNWTTSQTGAAVKKFVKTAGVAAPSDQPTLEFLDMLRGKSARVCPLECGAREVESGGRCVAKTCKDGFELDEDGDCVRQKGRNREPERPHGARRLVEENAAARGHISGARCRGRFPAVHGPRLQS